MCQANISPLIIAVFLACNIMSDIYLVSMPIPVLIRAPLKATQKLSLISLFSCNILITGMAIVRAVYIIKVSGWELVTLYLGPPPRQAAADRVQLDRTPGQMVTECGKSARHSSP